MPLLLATDLAARGLDVPGVGWVVQYDGPGNLEQYVHRCGRAGRGNSTESATVYTFFTRNLAAAGFLFFDEAGRGWACRRASTARRRAGAASILAPPLDMDGIYTYCGGGSGCWLVPWSIIMLLNMMLAPWSDLGRLSGIECTFIRRHGTYTTGKIWRCGSFEKEECHLVTSLDVLEYGFPLPVLSTVKEINMKYILWIMSYNKCRCGKCFRCCFFLRTGPCS